MSTHKGYAVVCRVQGQEAHWWPVGNKSMDVFSFEREAEVQRDIYIENNRLLARPTIMEYAVRPCRVEIEDQP